MGLRGHSQGGRKRARRASGTLRRQGAASLFAALVLLLGAIVPSWHQARAAVAAAELAQLQLLFGAQAEDFSTAICHHEDGGTSDLPDSDGSRLCKEHCLLFLALQLHAPAVAPRGIAWPAHTGVALASFVPQPAELRATREIQNQARPRAPPLA
ncbi:MAG: hypothetical protein ACLPPF_06010 [Rhodomicrobium sp.]